MSSMRSVFADNKCSRKRDELATLEAGVQSGVWERCDHLWLLCCCTCWDVPNVTSCPVRSRGSQGGGAE